MFRGTLCSECTTSFDEPCICANCSGHQPANYTLCPKFPGDHTQKNVKSLTKQSQHKDPPTRKANNAISFAAKIAFLRGFLCQNSSPSKIGAIPDVDFLNKIFKFEKKLENKLFSKPSESASRSTYGSRPDIYNTYIAIYPV